MKRVLFAGVVLVLCGVAVATESLIYKNGTFLVQLSTTDCPPGPMFDGVMAQGSLIVPKEAEIRSEGKGWRRACWGLDIDTDVVIFDANGESGFIPLAGFRRDTGI